VVKGALVTCPGTKGCQKLTASSADRKGKCVVAYGKAPDKKYFLIWGDKK